MRLLIAFLLTLPLWAQNNYAVDFNNAQNDKLYRAVANYRSSDQVGFISAWVVIDDVSLFNGVFASSDEGSTVLKVRAQVYASPNEYVSFIQHNNDTEDRSYGSQKITQGTWHHMVWGSNGSAFKLWLDGSEQTVSVFLGTDSGDWFADTNLRDNITVGGMIHTGNSSMMNGRVDELSVHNVIPTNSLVEAIYNGGTPRDVRNIGSSGVVNYWRFEEGSGQYAFDSVGSDTLFFGDDATVEADDPTWVVSTFGWDSGEMAEVENRFAKQKRFSKFPRW